MYKCLNCGFIFNYPISVEERVGEYMGTPAYERWDACPCCESTEITSVREDEEDDNA